MPDERRLIILGAAGRDFHNFNVCCRDNPAVRVVALGCDVILWDGGMRIGAGTIAARRFGAAAIIDPRQHAVGRIATTFENWPDIGAVLPPASSKTCKPRSTPPTATPS